MALKDFISSTINNINGFINNWQSEFKVRTTESFQWYVGLIKKIKGDIKEVRDITLTRRSVFNFYTFFYDSISYERGELPWYSAAPLDFIFRVEGEHFYALNWHYIHPLFRAKILKRLILIYQENFFEDKPLVGLTWKRFNSIIGSNRRYINFAIKKYRKDRIITRKGLIVQRVSNVDMIKSISLINPQWVGTDEKTARKMITAINFNLMNLTEANRKFNK